MNYSHTLTLTDKLSEALEEAQERETPDFSNSMPISEAKLSRLLQRVKEDDFTVFTGWRDPYNTDHSRPKSEWTKDQRDQHKKNIKANRDILKEFNSKKIGGYLLNGFWREEKEDGKSFKSEEDSLLFVKPEDMPRKEFQSMVIKFLKKYDQDAGIYAKIEDDKDPEISLLMKTGTLDKIGTKISVDKLADIYSTMKKGKKQKAGIPFIFEGLVHATGNIGCSALSRHGILHGRYI